MHAIRHKLRRDLTWEAASMWSSGIRTPPHGSYLHVGFGGSCSTESEIMRIGWSCRAARGAGEHNAENIMQASGSTKRRVSPRWFQLPRTDGIWCTTAAIRTSAQSVRIQGRSSPHQPCSAQQQTLRSAPPPGSVSVSAARCFVSSFVGSSW